MEKTALPNHLTKVLRDLGIVDLTPIQKAAIPLLLAGKDVIGQSKTGSGKTFAFGLPILAKVNAQHRRIQALIICPTRELCAQVARELRRAARDIPSLQILVLAGGQPAGPQKAALEKGAHIAVGTPGRVLDLLGRSLDLRSVKTVVLDEADRMLDMGFLDDVSAILDEAPPQRQTVLFSATFPEEVIAISRQFQKTPLKVEIVEPTNASPETNDSASTPPIQDTVLKVERGQKLVTLIHLLASTKPQTAVVFCNFKATVAELTQELLNRGAAAAGLHGDLEQFDRDRVMVRFRNHSVRILVTTDVAARGIDVEALSLVVNYDLPHKPEIYVHRVGRTGRAGRRGVAISLATRTDTEKIAGIEALLSRTLREQPIPQSSSDDLSALEADYTTISIGGGRKAKLRPGDILGALTGPTCGLAAASIGKIEIHDRHSFVAVAKEHAKAACHGLDQGSIKKRKFRCEIMR